MGNKDQIKLYVDVQPSKTCFYSRAIHSTPSIIINLCATNVTCPVKVAMLQIIYLTYLCGTTTNIWLRPVQEDPSMPACLEHSASNL
jgi:hypothetical protein